MSGEKIESAKLTWKAPKDDGGLPIKTYIVKKLNFQTGKWEDYKNVTTPTATVEVSEDKPYKFGSVAVNDVGESEMLTSSNDLDYGKMACKES